MGYNCFDTAENELCKICPLSVYRSPRVLREVAALAAVPSGSAAALDG